MDPVVSILIPVYNGEKYLGNCLDSTLDSVGNLGCDIIVVNDGSTDRTSEILAGYSTRYEKIRYLNQSNRGIEAALNNGLASCRTEIILRMDADDEMLPGRVVQQYEMLASNENISWTSGAAYLIDECGEHLATTWAPRSETIIKRIHHHNFIIHPSVAYRKSAVLAVGGYRKTRKFHEDIDLWVRLMDAGEVYKYSSEPVIKYRVSTASSRIENEAEATLKLARLLIYYGERRRANQRVRSLGLRKRVRIFVMSLFPTFYWKFKMTRGKRPD